jgi:hypothetical protein
MVSSHEHDNEYLISKVGRSHLDMTNGHMEINIIIKKGETLMGEVKRKSNASTVFKLIWKCSHGIHPRRRVCN